MNHSRNEFYFELGARIPDSFIENSCNIDQNRSVTDDINKKSLNGDAYEF
jgi:hypothetical protein